MSEIMQSRWDSKTAIPPANNCRATLFVDPEQCLIRSQDQRAVIRQSGRVRSQLALEHHVVHGDLIRPNQNTTLIGDASSVAKLLMSAQQGTGRIHEVRPVNRTAVEVSER